MALQSSGLNPSKGFNLPSGLLGGSGRGGLFKYDIAYQDPLHMPTYYQLVTKSPTFLSLNPRPQTLNS